MSASLGGEPLDGSHLFVVNNHLSTVGCGYYLWVILLQKGVAHLYIWLFMRGVE